MTKWMTIARDELGVKETVGDRHTPRILAYHQATGLKATSDEVPWCGSFVAWVFKRSGIDYSAVRAVAAGARQWLAWGREVKSRENIPIGALMVLSRGKAPAGHVTFFDGWVDGAKTRFWAVGGNQSNAVTRAQYPISQVLEHGIRWPKEVALPAAQERLRDSGVMRGAAVGTTVTTGLVVTEVYDIVQTQSDKIDQIREGFSAGDMIGLVLAGIAVLALGYVIYSRIKGKTQAQRVEEGL